MPVYRGLTSNEEVPAPHDSREPQEQLQVEWVSLDELLERVKKGNIIDAVTIAAVTKAKVKLRRRANQ